MKPKRMSSWDPESAPTYWINQASRLILRHFEKSLRPLGFGMAYLPVAGALARDGALQQKELAERTRVEQPTMAALLLRMERDGLIARTPHPSDKRASLVTLTSSARERLPRARELLWEGAERATAGLTQEEQTQLRTLLQRVVKNLEGDDI